MQKRSGSRAFYALLLGRVTVTFLPIRLVSGRLFLLVLIRMSAIVIVTAVTITGDEISGTAD